MSSVILSVVLVGFVLLAVLIGAKQGLFRNLVYFICLALANVSAALLGGKLGTFINDKFVYSPVYENIHGKITDIAANLQVDPKTDDILSVIPKFALNDQLRSELDLLQGSGEEYVASLSRTVATPVSNAISNVLGFIAVFVISFVVFDLISFYLNKIIKKTPGVSKINTILGAVWGFLIGVLLVTVVCGMMQVFFENSDFYAHSGVARFFGNTVFQGIWKLLNFSQNPFCSLFAS